jgi:hypothetical protein
VSDITKQLRAVIDLRGNQTPLSTMIPVCQKAADAIDRLTADLEAARANAHAWEDTANYHKQDADRLREALRDVYQITQGAVAAVRAALSREAK